MLVNSYNAFSCNPDAQKYDCFIIKFNELAMLTSTSKDHYMDVMHCVDMLLKKYKYSRYEPSLPSHEISLTSYKSNEAINGVLVKSTKVFSL
jgi:hypothetical protein